MSRPFVLFLLFLPLGGHAQKHQPRYDQPPTTIPPSCDFAVMSVGSLRGQPAYLRLAYEVRALSTAQQAVTAMKRGMEDLKSEAAPSVGMSAIFTATQEARNSLHCSAYLMSKYKPVDKDDETVRGLLIIAYNQEAAAVSDLEAHLKEQFLRSESQNTQAVAVKDAVRITAMNALQKDAAQTIAESTTLSLMMSVDVSNPAAKDTAQTVLECDQYADLKKSSGAIASDIQSAYTDAASLFVSFLDGHKCR